MNSAVLELLQELRARGVVARVHGENISLRPREALDRELLERVRALKLELLQHLALEPASPTVLRADSILGQPDAWREESIAECVRRLLDAGELIHEFAQSRWGHEAAGWSAQMLAGFYVRDMLGGLEIVLPWEGWSRLRARLNRQTGPTTIARLWSAYTSLPSATQAEVIECGDRSQSPPDCLVAGPKKASDA